MLGIMDSSFIIVFGIIMMVHEYRTLLYLKNILIRICHWEDRKSFSYWKDGTAYTIRILPLGGYVRMAGWSDDTTENQNWNTCQLRLTNGKKAGYSDKSIWQKIDQTALATSFDFEDRR